MADKSRIPNSLRENPFGNVTTETVRTELTMKLPKRRRVGRKRA